MPIFFEVSDPRGRNVVCTDEQWNGHVLAKRSWMAGYEQEVKEAIQRPTYGIFRDSDFDNRDVYYLILKRGEGKYRYIKVIVEFDEHENGRFITAYTTDSPKSGEVHVWPKSKD